MGICTNCQQKGFPYRNRWLFLILQPGKGNQASRRHRHKWNYCQKVWNNHITVQHVNALIVRPGWISGEICWIVLWHKGKLKHKTGAVCCHLQKSLSHSVRTKRRALPEEDLLCSRKQLCVRNNCMQCKIMPPLLQIFIKCHEVAITLNWTIVCSGFLLWG